MRISADMLLTCRGFSAGFRCAGSYSELVGVSREEEVMCHHTGGLRPPARGGKSKMLFELYIVY